MASPKGNYSKKLFLSWEQVHSQAKELSAVLKQKAAESGKPWKGIIAIPRGGMVAASLISRTLGVYYIDTFCVNSYDFQDQGEINVFKDIDRDSMEDQEGEGYLVIDDLSDTGKTFQFVRRVLPKAHYACVYVKPKGKPYADTYLYEVSQETWITHPWEDDNT